MFDLDKIIKQTWNNEEGKKQWLGKKMPINITIQISTQISHFPEK